MDLKQRCVEVIDKFADDHSDVESQNKTREFMHGELAQALIDAGLVANPWREVATDPPHEGWAGLGWIEAQSDCYLIYWERGKFWWESGHRAVTGKVSHWLDESRLPKPVNPAAIPAGGEGKP